MYLRGRGGGQDVAASLIPRMTTKDIPQRPLTCWKGLSAELQWEKNAVYHISSSRRLWSSTSSGRVPKS